MLLFSNPVALTGMTGLCLLPSEVTYRHMLIKYHCLLFLSHIFLFPVFRSPSISCFCIYIFLFSLSLVPMTIFHLFIFVTTFLTHFRILLFKATSFYLPIRTFTMLSLFIFSFIHSFLLSLPLPPSVLIPCPFPTFHFFFSLFASTLLENSISLSTCSFFLCGRVGQIPVLFLEKKQVKS